jgi:hypothetical protein
MTDTNTPIDPARPLVPHTTAEGLANAQVAASWDAREGATVSLPRPVVERLLRDRGWTRTDPRRPWHAPTGERFRELDEAVRAALSAEALDPARKQERPAAIDTDSRREFINNILTHDILLDEIDALLFEHVVEGRHAAVACRAAPADPRGVDRPNTRGLAAHRRAPHRRHPRTRSRRSAPPQDRPAALTRALGTTTPPHPEDRHHG